jgi:hypothetical protein
MLDTLEPSSIIEAAEQAASVGDYPSAERLLREAARLQETRLGPSHPDLANTLNNLGVVCEITEKPLEAEQCYRRAYAIATAALEPNHPFVTTSGKNLRAFCEAHGKPIDLPLPPVAPPPTPSTERPPTDLIVEHRPATQSVLEQPAARPVDTQRPVQPPPPTVASARRAGAPTMAPERASAPSPARPVAARQPQLAVESRPPSLIGKIFRPFPIAVVVISGLVLAVLIALARGPGWTGNGDRSAASPADENAPLASSAEKAAATQTAPSAPAAQKPPAAPAAQKAPAASAAPKTPVGGEKVPPAPGAARLEPGPTPNAAGSRRREELTAAAGPVLGVAIAQICRSLVTGEDAGPQGWRCDRPGSPVEPGQLFFFTRVKAAADTSVVHRWYRGDELRRSVELQIRASPAEGYRTYSRYLVDPSSRGDWRLELRTKQGVLLHEERFVVK